MARRITYGGCCELDEHATARTRVQEGDATGQAVARRGVDELDATILEADEGAADIGCLEAEVMQPLAASREKASDAGGGIERLEQLDLCIAGRQQRRADTLRRDRLFLQQRQAEHVAIEPIGVRQPPHRDADVMN